MGGLSRRRPSRAWGAATPCRRKPPLPAMPYRGCRGSRNRRRELEHTFGRWSDLQARWARRVAGEITDDQARQEVLDQIRERDEADKALQDARPHGGVRPGAGRPRKVDEQEEIKFDTGSG